MNKHHKRRIYCIILFILGLGLAASLILYSLKQNINVFLTPAEVTSKQLNSDHYFRLGGLVKPGSLNKNNTNLRRNFIVTDQKKEIRVIYQGTLPDLFREGKGVVVTGRFNHDGQFTASQVLAKHDENYMPPKVAKALLKNQVTT